MQDIIKACRSYRRFDESDRIDRKLLTAWVDAARLVASSGNAQPLRYAIVSDERACERVFSCCAWAKALPDWPGPVPGERPSAYVVVCRDNDRTLADTFTAWDEGIAAQTIMLQAVEAGFGLQQHARQRAFGHVVHARLVAPILGGTACRKVDDAYVFDGFA